MMILHVLATFLIVCFIILDWAETMQVVYDWQDWRDLAKSSLFTLAVGYILVIGWMK